MNKAVQGRVHSAFYNGYTLSQARAQAPARRPGWTGLTAHAPSSLQIPGGWAASKYGGHRVLSLSFLLWCTASLFTPSDGARTHALVAVRVLVGAAMGVVFPSIHSILVHWIPVHERSRAVSLFTSGMYFGSAWGMAVLPQLIARWGPGCVPRAVGLFGLAWLALWSRFANRPARGNHADGSLLPAGGSAKRRGEVPWSQLLRCVPIWALIINNFTFHYAFFILMAWLPTLYDSLGADSSRQGSLKMMPYLVMGVCSNVGGWAADALITRKFGVTKTRKLLNSAGFALASIALLMLPGASTLGNAVGLACWAMGALALARGGYSVNHMDIAPTHAGVLMGLSNGAGSAAGMVGPWVTGRILEGAGGGGVAAWHAACALPAGLCTAGAVVYALLGTGERLFD